ncbi:MAG: polyhydroxyalkanoic acid system family protein [Gammaproteobacteria bacterium]|jgi:putative polyhydroxyalkanoate system protein|nr:polyhydroxyalkanoic acid system family protein [Gammaproteobacteria bacterium]MDH3750874.1 polyhydroxyalkanoic acid system family protein [Gammaproteobacteria bacterium]MDH3804566.1 polyhydroxyalkanoic acid system family protein [Gammaproteobacteria bacterium]
MRIRRSHTLGLEEARVRIDRIAETLGQQYSLTSTWRGDYVVVRGNGVNGRIVVAHEYVEAEIRLGLAFLLMERQIRSGIEEVMDEHFGRPQF